MIKKILRVIYYWKHNPSEVFQEILKRFRPLLSERRYLCLMYRLKMGVKLNLDNPKTFNEKLQWLKLYNRKPIYTTMVDKYAVKDYVANIIGEKYIIPTLGVWDSVDDIDWDSLPNQFVLKTTHGGGGGGVVIVKDKTSLNKDVAKNILQNSMNIDIYKILCEWPYKNVPKRIIAEKFIAPIKNNIPEDLPDYKFYCFNGEPKIVMVATGRHEGDVRFDYFDMNWNKLPIVWDRPNSDLDIPIPACFEEMKQICYKLTKNIPHVRCDLYVLEDKTYFGELTFFDASGFCDFKDDEWNEKIGELITLPVFSSYGGQK